MSNELTDVRCSCGDEYPADSYDAGFIAGSGMCQNCDAALPPKDICTCPSGDGSLVHPCPAHPAPVEQAGGDERAAFFKHLIGRHPAHETEIVRVVEHNHAAWKAWQARAALAQPSPALPPFAEKVLAKLRRFYDCAEDFESGGVDIGRHWLDLLTQLGLLNRVQRSPALWEISQQGEDLLGLDVPEIEVPDSMIEKAWQRFERTLQQLETPGQAEQAEQAEAERPEVVAWQYRVTAGPQTGWSLWHPGKGEEFERSYTVERRPLMTVAQHDRIVGELRAERDGAIKLLGQSVWQKIERLTQERDAALARVAELEKQEPVAYVLFRDGEVYYETDDNIVISNTQGDETDLYRWLPVFTAPAAQAQQLHDLDKQCRDDVARALGLRPNQERGFAWSYLLASIKSCVKASEDSAQAQHCVPELLVRAEDFVSGKEVPQAWLDVQAERRRQITAEGWTPEHDDLYCAAELPRAAAAYILNGANDEAPAIWPFSAKWWKPRDARANYMRAGALILAEIERLDRATAPGKEGM